MRFYIAAKFDRQKAEVEKLRDALLRMGHKQTVDWTRHLPIKPYDKNPDLSREYSEADIRGVLDADVLIVLSHPEGRGLVGEMCAGIASRLIIGRLNEGLHLHLRVKPEIYAVGEHFGSSVFYFHPEVNQVKDVATLLRIMEKKYSD